MEPKKKMRIWEYVEQVEDFNKNQEYMYEVEYEDRISNEK